MEYRTLRSAVVDADGSEQVEALKRQVEAVKKQMEREKVDAEEAAKDSKALWERKASSTGSNDHSNAILVIF